MSKRNLNGINPIATSERSATSTSGKTTLDGGNHDSLAKKGFAQAARTIVDNAPEEKARILYRRTLA